MRVMTGQKYAPYQRAGMINHKPQQQHLIWQASQQQFRRMYMTDRLPPLTRMWCHAEFVLKTVKKMKLSEKHLTVEKYPQG